MSESNIFGFFASFQFEEPYKELVNTYLWGTNGLKEQLGDLKWQSYGEDFCLILFQIYVRPIPYLRENLKEIESYSRKEKSIAIPLILDDDNFFSLGEIDKRKFICLEISRKLELLSHVVKRKKLDLKVKKLTTDTEMILCNNN